MKRRSALFSTCVLLFTVFASYFCATMHLLAIWLSLPPTDTAYHQPLVFLDPFVWAVALPVSTLIGLVIFPVALYSLWHRDLLRCSFLVLGLASLTILCLTPFLSKLAPPIAVIVTVAGLLFCRLTSFPQLRQRPGVTSIT
jgi:hypothetical protein